MTLCQLLLFFGKVFVNYVTPVISEYEARFLFCFY